MLKFCSSFLLFWIAIGLSAQVSQRPKVGLVLSGGSAHGLSHIGVIKYLEDQGIPIDYVTGTSMGSIVGGLYAMGFSSSQIEEIAQEVDWDEILSGSTYLNEVAPSEKEIHNKFAINFLVKNGEISLPSGFINSQKLDLLISRLYCGAHFISDFDDLPRPFRCMAVDIENGDVIDFKSGNLSQAIRASMAIPSVFSPVEIDGRLYVDGGLIRNMPSWENIEMGSDLLIGVYVGGVLQEKEELNSLLDILNQSAFMMGILDSKEQKELVDVLIEPNVKEEPSFAFDRLDFFVEEGYNAAARQEEQIERIKQKLGSYEDAAFEKLRNPDALKLSKIAFPDTPQPFDQLAKFKFGPIRSKTYRISKIESAIDRIYGTKHFENISYRLEQADNGYKSMSIIAKPKKVTDLNANLNYFPTTGAALILNSELRNILADMSVLNINLRLAQNFGGSMQYNYRLGKKKDFILTALSSLTKYDQFLYDHQELRFNYSAIDFEGKLGVAYEPNNSIWVGIKSGVELNQLNPKGVSENGLKNFERINWVGEVFGEYNTLDKALLPNRGIKLGVNAAYKGELNESIEAGVNRSEFLPETNDYIMFNLYGLASLTMIDRVNVSFGGSFGWKSDESFLDNYRIGGLEYRNNISMPFIGFNTDQFQFATFLHLRAKLRFEIIDRTFIAAILDRGSGDRTFHLIDNRTDNLSSEFWGYGVTITRNSALGPISFSHGRNTLTNKWNSNFTIGYTFL